ncbi:ABC transporter permease subunit [Brenneria goodwinii]|uniref:amino acid ABC transporter permease n=1 Tax=Brenneria goodwinii TaxID=1109412 RepID=UPI000EF1A49B|nr:ABC transporter permease subunit [Brenneria goodwinii]MCG8155915.1 ABC transporter permease subunit [Brenneria goodwinii]MCG8162308.1 ABC transporter permease subunit [Brenneria goodwinii]MCG8166971.1 ABC transporter permease subunit [Brenneria goodwinii]MCG8169645.1 ABC transporter permease subunit [Brenneria goodwinii]MCG8174749.1 ABC transporter permease subunit [Brenneria goodwinii]
MADFYAQFLSWSPVLLNGAVTTASLCLTAIVAGFFVGVGIHLMERSRLRLCRGIAGAWVSLFRGTPVLAQMLLCFYLPGELGLEISSYLAAALALTLNTAAYQSQILRSGFAAIPPGQLEAAAICGLSARQTLWRIQVPQVLRLTLPSLISELIDVVKASAVVSVIAITDLMRVGQQLASATYQPLRVYIATALVYLLLTSLLALAGRYFERRWVKERT